jgi:ABC-type nitrate/sulfonate/bicarbonate transport system substrate-binding protein
MNISMTRRLCFSATALFLLAGAAQAQSLKSVTIATSSASIPAGAARLAKELGLFEKQGLQAKVTPMDNGALASAALVSGSVDFVTTGPSDVISAHARGMRLVVLTSGYRGFAATAVLSKAVAERLGVSPNAPVAARLKALDGLRIATTSASSTFAVGPKSAIEGVGGKATFTYMAQPAMVAAFKKGVIDGYIASAPYYLAPVADGSGYIWINGPKGDWPKESAPVNSVVLIAKGDFADANADLMRRMRAVFADFWKVVEDRPNDVKAAMMKLWPDLDATSLNQIFETERPGFKASAVTANDMVQEAAFMKLGGASVPSPLNAASMLAAP